MGSSAPQDGNEAFITNLNAEQRLETEKAQVDEARADGALRGIDASKAAREIMSNYAIRLNRGRG